MGDCHGPVQQLFAVEIATMVQIEARRSPRLEHPLAPSPKSAGDGAMYILGKNTASLILPVDTHLTGKFSTDFTVYMLSRFTGSIQPLTTAELSSTPAS